MTKTNNKVCGKHRWAEKTEGQVSKQRKLQKETKMQRTFGKTGFLWEVNAKIKVIGAPRKREMSKNEHKDT